MSKRRGGVVIAGVILVIVGVLICCISVFAMGFDFGRSDGETYKVTQYEVSQEFSDVKIWASVDDVEFVLSNDGKCAVECHEMEGIHHEVKVENGTLMISVKDEREWYQHFRFWTRSPKITVMLPKTALGSLSVETNTGDLKIPEGFTFTDVDVQVGTGDVKFENVIASGEMRIKTNTGDIHLQECDAATVSLKTNTGDVTGSFLSEKVFSVKTNVGDVDVPQSKTGGKCEIVTNVGDVQFEIK